MVARFRRTHSFPIPPSPSPLENKSYHVRSTSLPTCRSHPLITQLKDEITELKSWESNLHDRTSAWLCKGLIMLKNVHDSFEDLLHLSQTQESLRRHSDWFEKLLEDYLRFVDVYGIFRASIVELKEDQLEAQMAIRRKDESKIDSYVKSKKKMEKEMKKLVSSVRSIGMNPIQESDLPVFESECDVELDLILRDLNGVTVFVTICVIKGISSSTSSSSSKSWMKLWKKKEKKEEGIRELREVVGVLESRRKGGEDEERRRVLRSLEECIGDIENGSEKVFRSLINTRVSLLNILTQ